MKKLILTLVILYGFSANASLINNDVYTTDSATNLDWLDLTETLGMTSSEVNFLISSQWDPSIDGWAPSTFMGGGWRFANESEAIDLVTRNIGSDFGAYPIGSPESANADNLMNLLGLTYNSTFNSPFSAGLFISSSNELNLIKISSNEATRYTNSFNWYTTGGSAVGKFLVRENISAVPLPSSLLLLISGAALLLNYARRK